jgi:hypothetical protein
VCVCVCVYDVCVYDVCVYDVCVSVEESVGGGGESCVFARVCECLLCV